MKIIQSSIFITLRDRTLFIQDGYIVTQNIDTVRFFFLLFISFCSWQAKWPIGTHWSASLEANARVVVYNLGLWRATTIYFWTHFIYLCFSAFFSVFFRTLFIGHKLFKTLNFKKTMFLPSYDLLVFLLEKNLSRNHQKKSGKFTVIRLTAYLKFIP